MSWLKPWPTILSAPHRKARAIQKPRRSLKHLPHLARPATAKLLTARVRFYGNTVAMIYGSETSVRKAKDGKEFERTLIWTDTWLKRNGKWQIIAVQDMIAPKK